MLILIQLIVQYPDSKKLSSIVCMTSHHERHESQRILHHDLQQFEFIVLLSDVFMMLVRRPSSSSSEWKAFSRLRSNSHRSKKAISTRRLTLAITTITIMAGVILLLNGIDIHHTLNEDSFDQKSLAGKMKHVVVPALGEQAADIVRVKEEKAEVPAKEEEPAEEDEDVPDIQEKEGQDDLIETGTIEPIVIQMMNNHFFGPGYQRKIPDCIWRRRVLDCVVTKSADPHKATALMFHLPTFSSPSVTKYSPEQFRIGMTMESAAYYPNMLNSRFMSEFEIKMTYELDSDVPMLYSNEWVAYEKLFTPAKPVEEKTNALVYLNSNCGPKNGRDEIVRRIMELNQVPVHSYGRCLNNRKLPSSNDKLEIFSGYRFCIAMENSNSKDYVTEKLWQALNTGCLPIYYGAPNIADFLPVPTSEMILDYNAFGSPEKLSAELYRLSNDDEAYNGFFKWRTLALKDTLPGFRRLVQIADNGHSQCVLCQVIAEKRKKQQESAQQ